ncbi:MAG: VanW family protein [Candidatus Kerfeldbacteria bacterium]|nr:VanW family protein [Candidatus Kerfeldbacteria bacterium]
MSDRSPRASASPKQTTKTNPKQTTSRSAPDFSSGASSAATGRRGPFILLALLIVVVVVGAVAASFTVAYAQRFPPNLRIGSVAVGGARAEGAVESVRARVDQLLEQGLTFVSDQQEVVVAPTIGASDEFYYDLYGIDPAEAVEQAAARVMHASQPVRLVRQLQSALFGLTLQAVPSMNAGKLYDTLVANLSDDEQPAVDARPEIDRESYAITVRTELAGYRYDVGAAVRTAIQRLANLDTTPIPVPRVDDVPRVTAAQVNAMVPQLATVLDRAPFALRSGDSTFPVSKAALAPALFVDRTERGFALALHPDDLAPIFDSIVEAIDVPVQEGRFRLEEGRVAEFQQSQTGTTLDRQKTADALTAVLLDGGTTVEVVATEVRPKFDSATANTLGITERVGVGRTNFSGSPPNRRYNIGVAVDKLNGLLIEPGQEFSLITALGPVNGANGYKQELVIKGNRTIPEYGGGLCQIGTTLFRLILDAGLPVLERQNHSYRVSYYEPPVGMDATIYEPKPDFRFRNDYGTTLLLQARVEGDDLVFEFYGTSDGRTVHSSTPRVFNVTAPPKKRVIKTDELEPGVEKCLERAHPGADAEFTYAVTYADGTVAEEVFQSHYRAWGEVCLVGKKAKKSEDE